MSRKSLFWIACLTALLLIFLSSPAISSDELHYIAALRGNVQLKRSWWLWYGNAHEGDVLSGGDRLKIGSNSSATLVCNNLQSKNLSTGEIQVSSQCNGGGTLFRANDVLLPGRGSNNEQRPYLISPRNTAVRPDQPLHLSWNPVANATHYEVTLKRLARTLWTSPPVTQPKTVLQDTSILRTDESYLIVIKASTGATSSDTNEAAPVITVLSSEAIKEIDRQVTQIKTLGLEPDATTLGIAHFYRSTELKQDAIDALENAIKAGSKNAAIYQLQADLYQQIGLSRYAQQRYLEALELAKIGDNMGQQAEIQERLGLIARYLEDFQGAIAYLSAAESNYRALWDVNNPEVQAKLKTLQDAIRDSQSRIPSP